MASAEPPLSILVCALGGEGGGVLAQWLIDTAARCGVAAQSTSIPGVAQRTGATTYYLEFARPASPDPVFSLYPVPGAVDLFVASELLEATRQVALGFVARERAHVIASSERTLTTHEKMQLGDGRASDDALQAVLRAHSRVLDLFPMGDEARRAGTAISAVMLGAIAGSGLLPFARDAYEATIRASGKGVDASLAGFAAGYERMTKRQHGAATGDAAMFDAGAMIAAGRARVLEYQDERYAKLYDQRIARIADRDHDPQRGATRETARYLASWMAFDDVVRVAELKSRASRLARVRAEVRAGEHDVLRVYDHFRPRVPEIAALLPHALAARLLRWDTRRREPFAPAVKLPTHSLCGMLALRFLASLKGMRRRGTRYADEQAGIERWLAAIEGALVVAPATALEIALCGRLVKGYGATNERGKLNLEHILSHLAVASPLGADAERAAAIRAAREAALADDAGRALDATLVAQGLPPRPVRAQPVRFVRRKPTEREAA